MWLFNFIYHWMNDCSLYKKGYRYHKKGHLPCWRWSHKNVLSWILPVALKASFGIHSLLIPPFMSFFIPYSSAGTRNPPATIPPPRALASVGLQIPSALVSHLTGLAELERTYSKKFQGKAKLWDNRFCHGLKVRGMWVTVSHESRKEEALEF